MCRRYQSHGEGRKTGSLHTWFCFWQTQGAIAVLPFAALFEQLDALAAFQDVAFGHQGAADSKGTMTGHKGERVMKGELGAGKGVDGGLIASFRNQPFQISRMSIIHTNRQDFRRFIRMDFLKSSHQQRQGFS